LLSETSMDSLGEEKDENMADELSPGQEKPSAIESKAVSVENAPPVPPPAPVPSPSIPAPPPANQSTPTNTTSLSEAFGSLSTKTTSDVAPQPRTNDILTEKPIPIRPKPVAPISATDTPTMPITSQKEAAKKPIIDEMAAWKANEFVIGGIPETEPPVEVR
jgi:hypothetical protein